MKKLDTFLQQQRINQIKPYLPENSYCLDIGAFHGELFTSCKDKISKGIGVEPLLEKPLHGENFTIYPGYFPDDLPKNLKGKFDIITMLAVLEHIPEKEYTKLVTNCYLLLKKDGLVFVTVPSLKVDRVLKILTFLRLVDGMSLEEHHGYKPEDTDKIFAKPKFELVTRKIFQLGFNNLFVFRKT